MSKRQQSSDGYKDQLSLFDLLTNEKAERHEKSQAGAANINARLKEALALTLKEAPKSREQVCDKMTFLLGTEITRFMLDAWVSPSKEGHRFPAEYIPAFVLATGSLTSLHVLTDMCGVFAVPGADALRLEILKEQESLKAKEQGLKKKLALLAALEGK